MGWLKNLFRGEKREETPPSVGNAQAGKASFEDLLAALAAQVETEAGRQKRVAAARELATRKDVRSVQPLIDVLTEQPRSSYQWELYSAAASALGEIGDARAVEPLRSLLTKTNRKLEALQTEHEDIRTGKVYASVPQVELSANDKAQQVVRGAAAIIDRTLKRLGPSAPAPEPTVRGAAAPRTFAAPPATSQHPPATVPKDKAVDLAVRLELGSSDSPVRGVSLSPDGSMVATYPGAVMEVSGARTLFQLEGERAIWHPIRRSITFVKYEGETTTLLEREVDGGEHRTRSLGTVATSELGGFKPPGYSGATVLYSADGSTLGLRLEKRGLPDALVLLRDDQSEPKVVRISFRDMALSSDGKRVAISVGLGGKLQVYDCDGPTLLATWDAPVVLIQGSRMTDDFGGLEFEDDGGTLLAGTGEGYIHSHGIGMGASDLRSNTGVHARIVSLRRVPSTDFVVVGYGGGKLGIWNWRKQLLLRTVAAHSTHVDQISISADGRRIATCGGGRAKVWDLHL